MSVTFMVYGRDDSYWLQSDFLSNARAVSLCRQLNRLLEMEEQCQDSEDIHVEEVEHR